MMKKLFFILTILLFMYKPAAGNDCSAVAVSPQIKVTSSYGKLNYDLTKNTAEITAMATKFNMVEAGLFASGLSTVKVNFDITINTLGHLMGNSEFCVVPTDVNIFLGFEAPTIYLSNELVKDSCEYNLVMRHEKIHQQINKTTLEYYLPLFKDAVAKIITDIRPIHITNIDDIEMTTADLTRLYNQKLTPLVNYIKKEMLLEQQKLDNPNNYQYESSLCP